MNSTYRWIAIVGALLLAAMVGFAAWQAGVAHDAPARPLQGSAVSW